MFDYTNKVPVFDQLKGPLFPGDMVRITGSDDIEFFKLITASSICGYFIAGVFPYEDDKSVGSLVKVDNLDTMLIENRVRGYVEARVIFNNSKEVREGISFVYASEFPYFQRGIDELLPTITVINAFLQKLKNVTEDSFLHDYSVDTNNINGWIDKIVPRLNRCEKEKIFLESDTLLRLRFTAVGIQLQIDYEKAKREFDEKVNQNIQENQKEYFLREQLRVCNEELFGAESEIEDYENRIKELDAPENVKEKLYKELRKLANTQSSSPESYVQRNYLDAVLDLPWGICSKDAINLDKAEKILDEDHYGIKKVKERILEFLAVKQLNPDLKSQIICLVGPPGVGKTSIAASLAKAMKRKYVRVSLGGIHDESDIRGHRKTYVGAMPGRIINALSQAKVKNPLILLDEIDKVGHNVHGDPASALLEVLDPEQNKNFRDHFVELPFDLSDCMFIATANTLENIPRPLIDRMEIIELQTYTRTEKFHIAKNHLIPKQIKRHGLTRRTCKITDSAIREIIEFYTRESGVRGLEKQIASICRKVAKKLLSESISKAVIDQKDVKSYLGERKLLPESIKEEDLVGVVNGLAFTEVGGSLLEIEVAILNGSGKVELTGSLGDVMKESAHAAISYIRSRAAELEISEEFYKTKDIHIHVPEGAVPKDGPSAGITIMTALVSALTGCKVRRDIAMTGEITLRGRVLPIGGLKEKTMAAYLAGVKYVIIPEENKRDLEEIDSEAKENLIFIPCKTADEVLNHALIKNAQSLRVAMNTDMANEVNNIVENYSSKAINARI